MLRLAKILWALFLFSFPFSLRWVLHEEASYRFGHFSPWVTGFLYLPELFLWGAFALAWLSGLRVRFRWRKDRALLVLASLFVLNALLVSAWKGGLPLAGFFLLRLAEGGMVLWLFRSGLLSVASTVRGLLLGAFFQLVLASSQLLLNRSLGLSWLGESLLGPGIDNVAKVDLAEGAKRIRPYGTFLHANLLGAYFALLFFSVRPFLRSAQAWFWAILLGGGVLLSGSRAALLAFAMGLLLLAFLRLAPGLQGKRLLARFFAFFMAANALLLSFPRLVSSADPAWQARLDQVALSRAMAWAEPLGVGLRQFTLRMEEFAPAMLNPWEFQPVHNVYFLVLNELGIQGFLLLLLLILALLKKTSLSPAPVQTVSIFLLLLFAAFDHLLWDSFAGGVLAALVISLAFLSPAGQEKAP